MAGIMTVDANKLIDLIKQVLPDVRIISDAEQIAAFDEFEKDQRRTLPKIWTLKMFSTAIFNQPRSTKRALNYLYQHRDELDIQSEGGFIDYESTHNGWQIPADEIVKFDQQHQYHWR